MFLLLSKNSDPFFFFDFKMQNLIRISLSFALVFFSLVFVIIHLHRIIILHICKFLIYDRVYGDPRTKLVKTVLIRLLEYASSLDTISWC